MQHGLCSIGSGSEEEEALTSELTAELAADFERQCSAQIQQGDSQHSCSPHLSRYSSLQPAVSCSTAGSGALADEQLHPGSLYDQLGSGDGLSAGVVMKAVVDEFYERVMGSAELAGFFVGVNMDKQRHKFLLFASYALGGPDEYMQLHPDPWPQLYHVHQRLIAKHGELEVACSRAYAAVGNRAPGSSGSCTSCEVLCAACLLGMFLLRSLACIVLNDCPLGWAAVATQG